MAADTRVAKVGENASIDRGAACVPAVFRHALPPKAACDACSSVSLCLGGWLPGGCAIGGRYFLGSANARMTSPPRRPRSPPPDATVTNSSPFTMYTDGEENTPAPVLNFHSSSPLVAS